jgi:hypothetical protein
MPVGQHAQQAGLQVKRHVADFVEKERSAIGLLEAAAAHGLRTGEGPTLMAEEFGFQQVFPTTIAFALAETGPVSISIFDVRGSMVRRLVDGRFPAGTHHTTWDGRRDDGTAAASGIYYYRMTASGEVLTR